MTTEKEVIYVVQHVISSMILMRVCVLLLVCHYQKERITTEKMS